MEKNFFILFVILLSFSYFLQVFAIPATRTKNLNSEDESVFASLYKDHGEKMMVHMDERLIGRRVNLELHDYEGPGANKEHNPKSPGNG
ncbi:hypothetical protein MtrunA17_Chr6g0460751 [Medicago truncatula]|uniref:Transmembrane protein, putative n=1 Tax=Medicago truncatula TaxID=3880 RepID=A0A072U8W6_MEDTR|nr:transmembrane protein, putative [Medicago truncatula]RHN50738.1 hypothetical protein MtrunA17_Chr6g0460751 [Medicago truncatula]